MSQDPDKQPRSMEDIQKQIEVIAFYGDGADQLRALKLLKDMKGGSSVALPEPLTRSERIERMTRMMAVCDAEMLRLCFSRSHPHQLDGLGDRPPVVSDSDLSPEDEARALRCKTVPLIYREWPALKRAGQPQGYPRAKDAVTKQGWCQEFARNIIRGELQSRAANSTFLASLREPDVPQA